jgi:hypothetical protein
MLEGTFNLIHSSGYNKGLKKVKDNAINFSKWLGATYFYFNSDKGKWVHLIKETEVTDDELFDLYLEENKS